jgi:hypothetical protein
VEPVIYREEAVGLMFVVADILEELRVIHDLLEGDDGGEEAEGPEDQGRARCRERAHR